MPMPLQVLGFRPCHFFCGSQSTRTRLELLRERDRIAAYEQHSSHCMMMAAFVPPHRSSSVDGLLPWQMALADSLGQYSWQIVLAGSFWPLLGSSAWLHWALWLSCVVHLRLLFMRTSLACTSPRLEWWGSALHWYGLRLADSKQILVGLMRLRITG